MVHASAPSDGPQNGQLASAEAEKAWAAGEQIMAMMREEPDEINVNYIGAVIYDLLRKATRSSSTRIAELETALKPLAALAEFETGRRDDETFYARYGKPGIKITYADIRAARSALASPQREGDRPETAEGGAA